MGEGRVQRKNEGQHQMVSRQQNGVFTPQEASLEGLGDQLLQGPRDGRALAQSAREFGAPSPRALATF